MRLREYIIWAMSISALLSAELASAAFTNFPLDKVDWHMQQDLNTPVRQLFAAINERAVAVEADPIEYIEDVLLYSYGVTVLPSTGSAGPLYSEFDNPNFRPGIPPPWVHSRYPDGAGRFQVTVGPYDEEWVLPTSAIYDPEFDEWEIFVEWTRPGYTNIERVYATITNSIGPYSVTYEGTNYTGQTFVKRDLLDTMWDKLEEVAAYYVYPGSETNWADWWASSSSRDYDVIQRATNAFSIWMASPYVPRLSVDAALYRQYGTNVMIDLRLNRWGLFESGVAERIPSSDYMPTSTVSMARGWWSGTNWQTVVQPSAYQGYDFVAGDVPSPYGMDLRHYSQTNGTPSRPEIIYTGTNATPPLINITLEGTTVKLAHTNENTVTNITWNGVWDPYTGVGLSCVVTNDHEQVLVPSSSAIETLAIGSTSTNCWIKISMVSVTGSATNSDAWTMQWVDVDQWENINHHLYSEELNRMYHVVTQLVYTLPFAQGPDTTKPWEPRAVVTGSNTNMLDLAASQIRRSRLSRTSWSTNYPFFSSELSQVYNGERAALGEFDLGTGEQPATTINWPFTGIPAHWPHSWTYSTNDPPDDPVITVSNRPPAKASVIPTVYTLAKNEYDDSADTNTLYLPFALSFRGVGWGINNTAAPVNPDPVGNPDPLKPQVYVAGYSEWLGSADLAFDFEVPTNASAALWFGDYSGRWGFADFDICPPTRGESYAGPETASSGPGPCDQLRYPFYLYANAEADYALRWPYPWDGNGVLTDYDLMHHVDMGSGTNVIYTLAGTTSAYPPRAEEPSSPAVGDLIPGYRLADAQVMGYHITHMFIIFEWDFEYSD